MPLPLPTEYQDWREWASAMLQVLGQGDADVIAGGAAGGVGGGPGGVVVPPGFTPLWMQNVDNALFQGNVFGLAPTAPDIVFIDTAQIADAAIETAKLNDGAVVTTKIADAAIVSAKIGDLQVVTAKIDNLAVNHAKLANLAVDSANIVNAAINNALIANLAVGTANIINAAITTAKIGAAQVTNAEIASATILQANIAFAAVGSAQIIDASIGTADIGLAQITTALIANAAINNALIANLAVDTAQIAALAVTTAKIANLAVGSAQIQNLAVASAHIQDLAVETLKIADLNVTTDKVGYGAAGESSVFFDSSSAPQITSGVFADFCTLTLTPTQGGVIECEFNAILTCITGASTEVDVQVTRDDGTVIISPLIVSSRDEGESLMLKWVDSVNSGRVTTWHVQMRRHTGSTNTTAVSNRFMKAIEHVRAFYQNIALAAPVGQGPGQGTGGGGNINGISGRSLAFYY